jgi:hypothetical protein
MKYNQVGNVISGEETRSRFSQKSMKIFSKKRIEEIKKNKVNKEV